VRANFCRSLKAFNQPIAGGGRKGRRVEDFSVRLAFLERRLTLMEREVASLQSARTKNTTAERHLEAPARIVIPCDAPGLIASRAYPVEHGGSNWPYCWLGAEGPVQLVLPAAPVRPLRCRLIVAPHSAIDMSELEFTVNDKPVRCRVVNNDAGMKLIVFTMEASAASQIEIVFVGLKSIRPRDLGENDDSRLLAFRFYGAEIEYRLD
jgi:hypothetical protein